MLTDTDKFRLDCQLQLTPKWHSDLPEVKIYIDDEMLFHEKLELPKTFQIDKLLIPREHSISVEFVNKTNLDTIPGTDLDKAIIVDSIRFNKIESDRFVWAGLYYPKYDAQWEREQKEPPPKMLTYCNYLGWNGVWKLTFTVPIFTWIHRLENYGWIYD